MENHPIPQDVTGFKFKLIGSVTVKQFLYLLGFGILTTVAFVLDINIFLKVPLMLFFAGIGAALTFVPIEGRPMDLMIINFAKAIPSENRYIFRKKGVNLADFEFFKPPNIKQQKQEATQAQIQTSEHDEKKSMLLKRISTSSFKPDEEEAKFFKNVKSFFEDQDVSLPTVQKLPDKMPETADQVRPQNVPVINADKPLVDEKEVNKPAPQNAQGNIEKIQQEISEAKKMQESGAANGVDMESKIKALEEQLRQALNEKDELSKKVVEYESDKIKKDEQIFTPGEGAVAEPQQSQSVRFVSPNATLAAGFPTLPDVPNIILGIVKDPRGKTLPNILVEVVDENSVPVRAFKTNSLGQFASATPLANGVYKIYFEDPAKTHEFEIIEIELAGEIFNPIEVKSVDSREKLRRELFGNNTQMAT